MVIPPIAKDPHLKDLITCLTTGRREVVHVSGLWGSSAPMVAALSAAALPRTFLYITAHSEEADSARDDLELFLAKPCHLFPAWETLPGEGAASGEIEAERLRLCTALRDPGAEAPVEPTAQSDHPPARMIVAPIQALLQPVPSPEALARNTLRMVLGTVRGGGGKILTPESLLSWAIDRGYERLDMVESPGDVANRGDLVDLFVPGEMNPYRIQFFDDQVESIRCFDVTSQRSIKTHSSISVSAMPRLPHPTDAITTDFFSYLPAETVVVLDGPTEVQEMGEILGRRLRASGRLIAVADVFAGATRFLQVHLSRFAGQAVSGERSFEFAVTSASRFEGAATTAVAKLCRLASDHSVYVVCDNQSERQRLGELVAEQSPETAESIHFLLGVMHRGFVWTTSKTAVLSHHEIFHRQRLRRRIRKVHAGQPIESWTDLKPGDPVVHVIHGIAVFGGLKKMRKGHSRGQEEFLSLEFADRAMIHVPVSQIDLVQRYIGSGGRRPRLSKVGGKRWGKTTQQVTEAVSDLAESLLRVQALRRETRGTAYPADTPWQREFEAAFLYEETEDQLTAAEDIRTDLRKEQSMDRLLCGDVGYGKTELAMRAAFKVAEYGRQVAVLVPTTVLAEQHDQTFRERFADYPFVIGCLSRFRTPAQQRDLLEKTKKGQIDIVIGTHRLFSKDVFFSDLGLVIIDEEQRFGVEHKERLKAMRETVDVLTLTATPIPRTLHMSLMGVRDISALQTPPVDRRSIATQVRSFEDSLIRDAILREIHRDGQVYFVHNFVQSIAAMTDTIRRIVPEARVVYGHGQMKDHELETIMHRFVRGEADVLVATTIIESGIDIPRANTIFINRADRFGLADLHQLRGRVGRSRHRAYCYLLLSPRRPPTAKAGKRLKTIEEFSDLGAGFRIAMRDLEIRGAGNLLGSQQSGHIAAVGYEMYCRLLDQAVRRLRHEPDRSPGPVQVDLEVAAHIPAYYIRTDRLRIETYRRIVSCRSKADLEQLDRDLQDAFGKVPPPVDRLLQLAEVRVQARQLGISSISLRGPDLVFLVKEVAKVEPVFRNAPGTTRMPDAKTVHLRLPRSYLEPETLLPVLRNMLTKAVTQRECAL